MACIKISSFYRVSSNLAYGVVNAMLSIVIKACWILGDPSKRARESCLQVRDSNTVGNSVVLSLQIWDIETAAEVLKGSFFVVW